DGVFKSLDAGATWVRVENGLPSHPFTVALALAPSAPSTVFVSIGGGVYTTTNGGGIWSKANTGITDYVLTLAVDPADPLKVLAGTAAGGLFDTVDGGQTWTHVISSVLPEEVSVLTIDPTSGQTVYAAGC